MSVMENQNNMTQDQFQIVADVSSSLNFVFQQNGIPLIRGLIFKSGKQLTKGKLIISASPKFMANVEVQIGTHDAEQSIYLTTPKLHFDVGFLLELTENIQATLKFQWVDDSEVVLVEHYHTLELLTVDSWGGEKQPFELLASFSQPNATALLPILKEASEWLEDKKMGSLTG